LISTEREVKTVDLPLRTPTVPESVLANKRWGANYVYENRDRLARNSRRSPSHGGEQEKRGTIIRLTLVRQIKHLSMKFARAKIIAALI
jgi:hypothetical protein